jgi:hypothetical protein
LWINENMKNDPEITNEMKEEGAAVLTRYLGNSSLTAYGRYDLFAWKAVAEIYEAMKKKETT